MDVSLLLVPDIVCVFCLYFSQTNQKYIMFGPSRSRLKSIFTVPLLLTLSSRGAQTF